MNRMNFVKKIIISSTLSTFLVPLVFLAPNAHAQTASSFSSTFKNAVDTTKENGAKNSASRNQLIIDQSLDIQNKEQILNDELNLEIMNLENIQTRITADAAETEASGTDTTNVNAWLASSSADILKAQNAIFFFSSNIEAASTTPIDQSELTEARKLATTAIDSVNTTHNDLQSALNALTAIL